MRGVQCTPEKVRLKCRQNFFGFSTEFLKNKVQEQVCDQNVLLIQLAFPVPIYWIENKFSLSFALRLCRSYILKYFHYSFK